MTAANLDEILGPEPTVEEQPQVEQAVEPVAEAPVETPAEVTPIENKQSPEQIVENYKKMAHAERMERKELQAQMRTMQERFEKLMAAIPQQQAEPEPEYNDDPLGATFSRVDKVAQSVEQLKAEAEQRKHADAYQGFVRQIQADEAAFQQKTPDYKEAVNFLQSRRIAELQAMGHDDGTIRQAIAQDAMQLTQRAMQMGESPAAFAYNMAQKLGYSAKPTPKQNLDTIAAGQQVAKSVSGGAQPVSEGSLPNNLAEMSDAEFDALFKQMSKS